MTAIFCNGAGWDQHWIDKIFPGTMSHQHKPDAVVSDFSELAELFNQFLGYTVLGQAMDKSTALSLNK